MTRTGRGRQRGCRRRSGPEYLGARQIIGLANYKCWDILSRMTASSRREFIRHAGVIAGGAAVLRRIPGLHASTDLDDRVQAAGTRTDSVAAMRAQMGAAPITTTKLGDRLLMLSGPGGNVVALHGPDGKLVVDSFVQPAWPKLKSTLDALDGGAIKTLVDTHWHFDHTDNNGHFRETGAGILADVNTKA